MFAEHQAALSKAAARGPDGFVAICQFALCTIRMPLHLAVADSRAIRRGADPENLRSIFGAKHAGMAYLAEHGADLWEACERLYDAAGSDAEDDILIELIRIPGIGPAKGGFIAQMCYGLSGCIDTHNLTRFGLSERTFRVRPDVSPSRNRARIADYNGFCRKVGGTAYLWDSWCAFVAERDPVNYRDAEYVSALHLAPIGG